MKKKMLKLAGIGFLSGIVICNFIMILTGKNSEFVTPLFAERIGNPKTAALLQFFLSGVYGALTMGAVVLYDLDRLPLALATFLHCLICIVPFFPLALLLGWTGGIGEAFLMAGFQLAAFVIVWLIMFFRCRIMTKKLNEMQRQILEDTESKKENY